MSIRLRNTKQAECSICGELVFDVEDEAAPVAQPGRAPLCEVGGCGFESRRKGPAQVQTTRQAGQGKYG